MQSSFTVWDKENLLLPQHVCLSCHESIHIEDVQNITVISCPQCGHNMELIPIPLPSGRNHIFLRSPDMKFCPFSGMEYKHRSEFDTHEFAGGGLRNASLSLHNIFGTPHPNRSWTFKYKMKAEVPDFDNNEVIVHVLVNKGQVYGITNKSTLLIFDIYGDRFLFRERREGPPDNLTKIQGAIYLNDHIIVAGEYFYIQWNISKPSAPPQQKSFQSVSIWGAPLIIDQEKGTFLLQFRGIDFDTHSRMQIFSVESQLPIQSYYDHNDVGKLAPAIYLESQQNLFWVNEDLSLCRYDIKTEEMHVVIPSSDGGLFQSAFPLCTAKITSNNTILRFYCIDMIDDTTKIFRCSIDLDSLETDTFWDTQYLNETPGIPMGLFIGSMEDYPPLVLVTENGLRIIHDSEFDGNFDIWVPTSEPQDSSNIHTIHEYPIITPIGVLYRTKNHVGLVGSKELGWGDSQAKAYALTIQKSKPHASNINNCSFTVSGQKLLVAVENTIKLFDITKDNT